MIDPIKLMTMLKKANDFKQRIEAELKNVSVSGAAGENMISIDINGMFDVTNVFIHKDVFLHKDVHFLQDLVKSCVNDANNKVKNALMDKVKSLTNKINLF